MLPRFLRPLSTSTRALSKQPKAVQAIKVNSMPVERASADRSDELIKNYERINERVTRAASKRPRTAAPVSCTRLVIEGRRDLMNAVGRSTVTSQNPRLVAVSKLKPSSDILALHEHGVRHFGENYPQELEAKAKEVRCLHPAPCTAPRAI